MEIRKHKQLVLVFDRSVDKKTAEDTDGMVLLYYHCDWTYEDIRDDLARYLPDSVEFALYSLESFKDMFNRWELRQYDCWISFISVEE